jgi:hypothetical protein
LKVKAGGARSNHCALKDYNLNNKQPAASADILPAFSRMLGKKRGFLSG